MTRPDENLLFGKFSPIECWKKNDLAAVYLAHHIYLDKDIVLKTLRLDNPAGGAVLQRFQREARLLAQLDHPNIIKVLDFGSDGTFFYISFEYVAGHDLRDAIKNNSLCYKDKLAVFCQVAKALSAAHDKGVIHRDLKPENILLDEQLQVRLADFGLALQESESGLTEASSLVGTPAYLSPEQIRGEKLTPQSDLFSLGIIACEMFSGANPFIGADVGATIQNIMKKSADACVAGMQNVPGTLSALITALLQRNRSRRPATADDVSHTLEALLQEETPAKVISPVKRSHRRLWTAVFTAMVMVCAVIMGWLLLRDPGPELPPLQVEKPVVKSDSLEFVEKETIQTSPEIRPDKEPVTSARAVTTEIKEGPARVMISCTPWATVYIDSMQIDTTPLARPVLVYPGEHEVALVHPGFPAWRRMVTFAPEEERTITVHLDSLYGFLEPRIHPWGEVTIDDVERGVTPWSRPLALPPGPHRLRIRHPQWGEMEEQISIEAADTLRIEVDMERLAGKRILEK